mgnify:CR=1 FL=1|tara:strand:+ start:2258 stop:3469 length:1212 start_codon:yes stop_codon:yes gene_type:complete
MRPPIVVLGGGVIGSSIAYHLTLQGAACVVVDERPAGCASGKAAGFLAAGWGDRTTDRLHRRSFAMHEQLASTLKLESYRRLPTLNAFRRGDDGWDDGNQPVVDWLDGDDAQHALLDADTAQVDPAELSAAMLDAAVARGARLVRDEAVGLALEPLSDEELLDEPAGKRGCTRKVTGVELRDGGTLHATQVVAAMGPWTCKLEDWVGVPVPLDGVWSTSLVWEGVEAATSEPAVVFAEQEDEHGCTLEAYCRPSGELYVCGCGGSAIVPTEALRAGEVPPADTDRPKAARVAAAERSLRGLSSIGARPSDRQQACMRPCPPDGLPMIGGVPGVRDLYVATGHNAWGILLAPVTGELMAELLLDGETSLPLQPFSLRRFDTSTYRSLLQFRGRRKGDQAVGEQW